jgi:FMN phosphatase YigB (HAD superfamily)
LLLAHEVELVADFGQLEIFSGGFEHHGIAHGIDRDLLFVGARLRDVHLAARLGIEQVLLIRRGEDGGDAAAGELPA